MTILAKGKGYFIWRISACEEGESDIIASLAKQANFSHVLVKIADGNYSYNIDTDTGTDLVPPLASALRNNGIQVWGWHYLYGEDPIGEANKAIQRIEKIQPECYIIDVEGEFKEPGKDQAAEKFMTRLRSVFPDLPVALCSYRYPSYHPQVPWKVFLEKCDYNMPQVYWELAHNPEEQLARSINEFKNITPYRPIMPVGAAYKRGDWSPTIDDVEKFMVTAQNLHLNSASFWEWSHSRKHLPDVWDAISDFPWSTPSDPVEITHEYISALNDHDLDHIVSLYTANAVHVNAARTIQGQGAIRTWYKNLIEQLLVNPAFVHVGYSGSGNSRNFTWTATSDSGMVNNGNDTLGLSNGKIAYHYTRFSVT